MVKVLCSGTNLVEAPNRIVTSTVWFLV